MELKNVSPYQYCTHCANRISGVSLQPLYWVYDEERGPLYTGLFCPEHFKLHAEDPGTFETEAEARAYLVTQALS